MLGFEPRPSLIKIDVEGAEIEVLRGSSRLFEACRPIVLCEVIPDTSPEVTEFFSSRGYQIFDGEIEPAKRQPLDLAPGVPWRSPPEGMRAHWTGRAGSTTMPDQPGDDLSGACGKARGRPFPLR